MQGSSDLGGAQTPCSTTVTRAGPSTAQPNARESCDSQTLSRAGTEAGALGAWKHTHSTPGEPGRKISPSCNVLFRALNLTEGKGKILAGPRFIFTDQATKDGFGNERQKSETGTSCRSLYRYLEVISNHNIFI